MTSFSRRLAMIATVGFLALTGGAEAKEWTKIRFGVEGAYPPFSSVSPDGQLQGFDIDIANALCAEMKADCEIVNQSFDGLIPALKAKKIRKFKKAKYVTE